MFSKITIPALIILYLFSIPTFAQEVPFSNGVNLTNWFQVSSPQQVQFNKYNLNDFMQIKSLGCDVIRLPVNLIAMTNGDPEYVIDPLFYTFMDSVIYWAELTDMHLILDNHTFDPATNTTEDIGNFLLKAWPQIAYKYRNSYDKLYFEILNEPHGIDDSVWNSIQQSVISKIRLVDTKHYLIVGPAGWNSYHNLKYMPVYNDSKLIYTFHFYDPFLFTHQGASWVDPSMDKITNIPFPYESNSMPSLDSKYNGSWIESLYNEYPNNGNVQYIQQLLDIAIDFKNDRGVPIFCGEFGVLLDYTENDDRAYWYKKVRAYLEENGIAWTIWDYHGGFGIFKPGGNELFDHDLNMALVEALGFNIPDQTEIQIVPDSSSFIVYDDFIGKNIIEASNTSGSLALHATDNPKTGNYFINWNDPDQYNQIGFDFRPNKDLSVLVDNDYRLEFWLKGNQPGSKLDLRFVDTKTGINGDKPWRMRYVLDEDELAWDGNWHKISIPLKDFSEHGSWDENTWYEPIGAFDWSAIDNFDIVDEYGAQKPVSFGFDQIEILGQALIISSTSKNNDVVLYPNPSHASIQLINLDKPYDSYNIYDLNGNKIIEGKLSSTQQMEINTLNSGLYIINIYNMNKLIHTTKFMKG